MKKILYLFFLMLIADVAISQGNQLKAPGPVLTAFKSKYPKAANVSWNNSQNNYVAEFKDGMNRTRAIYDQNGTFVESQTSIKKELLPEKVRSTVGAEFKGYNTIEHATIARPNTEESYKVVVDRGTEMVELELDNNGMITKTIRNPK